MSSIEQSADAQPVGGAADFAVGGVIGKTLSIFGRHFAWFILISGVITLPYLLLLLGDHQYAALLHSPGSSGSKSYAQVQFINFVVVILEAIAQGAVMQAAYADLCGQLVDIGSSVRQGLKRSVSLIGISILQGFGIFFGFVLLIVPGFLLYAMWYIASCACVIEELGAMPSVKRSTVLTRGNRWKVLGIGLIAALVVVAPQLIVNKVLFPVVGETPWVFISYAIQAVYLPLLAVLSVVAYHDLRAAKEGLGVERISAVFD